MNAEGIPSGGKISGILRPVHTDGNQCDSDVTFTKGVLMESAQAASSSEHIIDIKKHVRAYIAVFVALMALTIVTVTVSYLHLNVTAAVTVALIIATIKGSLVAGYFMHLISEKKIIYVVLMFTVAIFIGLMFFPIFGQSDTIINTNVP